MIIVMKCIKVRSYVLLSKRKMSFTLNLQQMVGKQKCDTKKKDKYTKKKTMSAISQFFLNYSYFNQAS